MPILSALLGTSVVMSPGPQFIPLEEWEPSVGDMFLVVTQLNVWYLVHSDTSFTSFPVGSGIRGYVRWIGRTYKATTPERDWSVLTQEITGDRITFGKRGIFLRLFFDGETTPYGIHSVSNIDEILGFENRFKSKGCILVSEEVLTLLMEIYELNENDLRVVTKFGLQQAS